MFVGCKSPIARCGVYERAVNNFLGASRNSFPKVNDRLITRGVLLDIARLSGMDRLAESYAITSEDLDGPMRPRGCARSRATSC